MAVMMITVVLYILLQVEDVSTQSCIIRPDLTELTIRNPLGRDVELHCQCRDMNGEEIETWWFNGNTVVSRSNSARPYSTNTNPSRLIISALFTDADAGVYTCANANTMSGASTTDAITLNAQAEPGSNLGTTCTIISTSIPGLAVTGGLIVIGTENVTIYCICMRGSDNVAVGPIIWSRSNGQLTLAVTDETDINPYYRNNLPSPLIIPSFNATYADTYRCRSGAVPGDGNANVDDTIDLSAQAQSCVISPNISSLTIRNRLQRDIELHCQCVDVKGIPLTGARWFSGNNLILAQSGQSDNRNPYYIDDVPSRLIIASGTFMGSLATTYTCGLSDIAPPRDTIILNDGGVPEGISRVCTIYSTKLIISTVAGGLITSGTTNVILYCVCRTQDIAVGPTTWFNGDTELTTASENNPYFRNNVPSPLIFSSFIMANAGTYSCGSNNSPNITVDLDLLGEISPPTSVTVTLLTPRSIHVMWNRPSPPTNINGYRISYISVASYTRGGNMMVSGRNTLSDTLSTLEEDTAYTITVQSTSSNGLSIDSNTVDITTYRAVPSSPPQNVMVKSVIPASLMVSWEPPPSIDHNGPITGYVIQYTRVGSSDMMDVNFNSEIRQYNILGLVAYVNYSVMVAARNSNGTGDYSDAMVVRSGENVPSAPRSFMPMNVNDTAVTLSWLPPDPPNGIIITYQLGFQINVGSSENSITAVNISATSRTHTVTGLMTGIQYRFILTAFTIVGRGNSSLFLAIVEISAPQNVKATVLSRSSIEVTWDELSGAIGYLVLYTTNVSYVSGDSVRVIGSANTSYILNNLEEGTSYIITVQYVNNDDRLSDESIEMSVTTYTDVPSSPPQNIMVTSVNPASLMVSWLPPPPIDHNGPITYVIQHTRVGSSDMMTVNASSVTTHTLSGLVAYVNYSVAVAARTVNGTGPFSNAEVGRSGEGVPSEPHSLQAVYINSNSVTLQWMQPENPNGGITQYSIQFGDTIVNDFGSNALMDTIQGLSPDTVYMLQLRAHTIVGEGPPANIIVTTAPGPVSNVTVSSELITSSTLTLTWMEINVTNSVLLRYTVFYLPVSGPYGPFTASNRRKRQLTQPVELAMNFTTDTAGTLMDLNGSVTYSIEVAAITMANDQELIGGRSPAIQISTSEGVPTAPRNLNYTNRTSSGVTLTWNIPDPPNGLITQYNISYNVTNLQGQTFYNFTVLKVDVGNNSVLSYVWNNLIQGNYWFTVVASTRLGQGKATSLMLFIITEANCDCSSDDKSGVIAALATLLAIAVIGLVVSVVIIVFLVIQHKQSRYAVSQSNVRYSDVKQSVSRDHTIKESTNKHIKPSEPEYEAVDNVKPCCDVKMDANPAYQTTT